MVKLIKRRPKEDIIGELKQSINELWSAVLKDRKRIEALEKENADIKAELDDLKAVKINDNDADATQLLNEFFCGAKGDYK